MKTRHVLERQPLVPIGEAAKMLGVSIRTLTRWADTGKVAATRTIGGHRRFTREEIERVRGEARR